MMSVSNTWTRTVLPCFQHLRQARHQQHRSTQFQQVLPFNCWLLLSYEALIVYSSFHANSATTMHGNGGLHGLISWTPCPSILCALWMAGSFLNFIFATQLIGITTQLINNIGCNFTVLATWHFPIQ
jgi:hypothetical protein